MSFKKNIFSNYVSQFYVTLIGIVMVPMYIGYMGAEAYGLVGFFAMLQAWFQLLDMGLTPTMVRATARFNGGADDALTLRRLFRALEGVFLIVAFLGYIAIFCGANIIARDWLKVQILSLQDVYLSVVLMGAIVALRWICGLYRGAISGFEQLVWLSSFNIAISTFRFVLVIPVFIFIGTSPVEFFFYQFIIAIIETVILISKTYSLLPIVSRQHKISWQLEPIRGVLKFSLSIAFTSSVWVLVTQTDKLVLSKLLPLSDYAYFTLAVLVASGVMVISGPISAALLPRLTKLSAQGDDSELIRLYRGSTQLVAAIAIPVALILALFSEQVLWAWTGDLRISQQASEVLTLYALGNGVLSIAAFPYYLQYAKGDLKLHLIGNLLFVVLLIPTLIWATLAYGVVGAGYAWLASNSIYFALWIPKIHARFVKGLHLQWLCHDVGVIVLMNFTAAVLLKAMLKWPNDRISVGVTIGLIGILLLLVSTASSSMLRGVITRRNNLGFLNKVEKWIRTKRK